MDKFVEFAQRGGRWGIAGLFAWVAKAAIVMVAHPSLDSAADVLGTLGWSLTLTGILANTKRGNDMTATIGAESKIDRAVIATAVAGPEAAAVIPKSSDPAVDREIKKQLNGSATTPPGGVGQRPELAKS